MTFKSQKRKYRNGGTTSTVGSGMIDPDSNKHVFKEGGVAEYGNDSKDARLKKGVPGYKLRRWLKEKFESDKDEEKEMEKPKKKKKRKYELINSLFEK